MTNMQISYIRQCCCISYFPAPVHQASGTQILLSFSAYGTATLSFFFLITTLCLLEISQLPLLCGDMLIFMFSVTFMQDTENIFNHQTYPSFIGSTHR